MQDREIEGGNVGALVQKSGDAPVEVREVVMGCPVCGKSHTFSEPCDFELETKNKMSVGFAAHLGQAPIGVRGLPILEGLISEESLLRERAEKAERMLVGAYEEIARFQGLVEKAERMLVEQQREIVRLKEIVDRLPGRP